MRLSTIAFQARLRRFYLFQWLKLHFTPPKFYVATYGDMGLQVEFFRDRAAYDEAVQQAEKDHEYDRIDSWTDGELSDELY